MKNVIKFSPLLLIYICIVLLASTNIFQGDENRYVKFATNLTNGYYVSQNNMDLRNGPGYPIILFPFALLNLPWFTAKLLNALFLFIAIIYFYYTLCLYIDRKPALVISYLLGLYPPFMRDLPRLYTEPLVCFLICGFMFHFTKLCKDNEKSNIHLLITSIYLSFVALTKIFFGYVILSCLLLFLSLYVFKKRKAFKHSLLVCIFAFLFCMPYLFYTYSITGEVFYWGNSGGRLLYWMSSPYKNDLGDWQSFETLDKNPQLYKNHHKFYEQLSNLDYIRRDEEFKRKAFYNIINNPRQYICNWIANIGRLLFSYPYAYTPQKISTFFYMIPNIFIGVLSVLSIYPTYLVRKSLPEEICSLVLFALVYFFGTSLLSAYPRFFQVIVPILFLWISFVFFRVLKIEIQNNTPDLC